MYGLFQMRRATGGQKPSDSGMRVGPERAVRRRRLSDVAEMLFTKRHMRRDAVSAGTDVRVLQRVYAGTLRTRLQMRVSGQRVLPTNSHLYTQQRLHMSEYGVSAGTEVLFTRRRLRDTSVFSATSVRTVEPLSDDRLWRRKHLPGCRPRRLSADHGMRAQSSISLLRTRLSLSLIHI